jgi:hypothetical protein
LWLRVRVIRGRQRFGRQAGQHPQHAVAGCGHLALPRQPHQAFQFLAVFQHAFHQRVQARVAQLAGQDFVDEPRIAGFPRGAPVWKRMVCSTHSVSAISCSCRSLLSIWRACQGSQISDGQEEQHQHDRQQPAQGLRLGKRGQDEKRDASWEIVSLRLAILSKRRYCGFPQLP